MPRSSQLPGADCAATPALQRQLSSISLFTRKVLPLPPQMRRAACNGFYKEERASQREVTKHECLSAVLIPSLVIFKIDSFIQFVFNDRYCDCMHAAPALPDRGAPTSGDF